MSFSSSDLALAYKVSAQLFAYGNSALQTVQARPVSYFKLLYVVDLRHYRNIKVNFKKLKCVTC